MEHGQTVAMVFLGLGTISIIIVRIVTRHQQRMAEIASRPGSQQGETEIAKLRGEVSELKELLHQQIIAMDSMHREHSLKERLEQKN